MIIKEAVTQLMLSSPADFFAISSIVIEGPSNVLLIFGCLLIREYQVWAKSSVILV